MKPRVLINCKWKSQPRITGVQRYAYELADALARSGAELDSAIPSTGSRVRSAWWEQRTLAKQSRDYDALLCPANMAPLVMPSGVRLILTIHCLRFHFHPENYSRGFVAWYRFMIPRLISNADAVLTVSRCTADEIQRVYPHASGKLRVVYPGVSGAFQAQGPREDSAISSRPYWVFIGNAAPAKNLSVLLEAMTHARLSHRLVLLGVDDVQLAQFDIPFPKERVLALGHINEPERIATILRGATGLLSPSLYESFDLPTTEAMSCRCLVIASDTQVHREIGESAPVFVPPQDARQWANEMDRLMEDEETAAKHKLLGVDRASEFRWENAAAQVISLINGLSSKNQ